MKKTLLLLVALITATIAFAQTKIDGIYYNLNNSTQTAEVTYQYYYSSNNYSGVTSISIPEKVTYNSTEYSVTSIGDSAFYFCSSLTSITIPNSVTSIGSYAFSWCSSLTSISIPNSVTSIGFSAFSYCDDLTSITIPNSVTSIGRYAFSSCESLTSITIPNSVTSIGGYAFDGTPWLNNQPDGCLYIGKCLYQYKGEMPENTHIDVNEGTTMISGGAFLNCSSLTSITIPNSVTSIGIHAFSSCSSLTSITIPNSVTSIGSYAFSSCESLTSISIEATTPPTLNDGLGYRGMIYIPDNTLSAYKEAWGTDYIFVNNENTLTIHVETPGTLSDKIFDAGQRPVNVTKLTVTGTLNYDDFTCMRETMTSLVDVDLFGITNTSGVNFNNKRNLLKILLPENLTSIGNNAFYNCYSLTSITIPNSVTSIGYEAFEDCSSLTSISIPNSVTSIGSSAFYDCDALTSVHISDIAAWCNIDFNNYASNPLRYAKNLYLNGEEVTNLVIPEDVTSIGSYAFYNCSSLTSITIPNSVTSVGEDAFVGCSSLTSITCLGSTPPEASDLGAPTSTCTLIVPKVAYSSYLRHDYWGQFLNIETIDVDYKKLTVIANNDEWGVVEGSGYYDNGDEATLTATANSCYHFVKWSDDVTDNPRTVVVTQDSTFTAIFEANTFTITTAINDDAMGSVTEGGEYAYGTEITLTATANSGYRFAQWSDGNTDNPRIITVTENKTYTAEFEVETFTITTASEVPSMGGVKVILVAEPIEGFEFVEWTDGNTDNPRTLTLTENIEVYARFQIAQGGNLVDLETSKISSANIYTTNGTLHIEGATENYHILDAAGRLIYSGNASTLNLPRGIYLITINGEVEKIVL